MRARSAGPVRLAASLAVLGVVIAVVGIATAHAEAGFVIGLFFVFLAGGVLNWDRRAGH